MSLKLETAESRIDFSVQGERFTSYEYGGMSPGFSCLYARGGRAVTEQDRETGLSLWSAHGNVNGVAFGSADSQGSLQGAGRIVNSEIVARRGPVSIGFRQICEWRGPDGFLHLTDTRIVRVTPGPSEGAILEIGLMLSAPETQPVFLGQTERSLLLIRLAPPLLPANGGQIRNSVGDYGVEALHALHGRSASWCACTGVVQGETVGLVFLEHPHNPWFPSPWIVRSEGLLSPSPFQWRSVEIEPGRSLSLRYRILVHTGYVEAGWAQDRLREWSRE